MEINDLTGLSKPLKKLIEVVAQGVGAITKPYLTRKMADAKAYEINTIAKAIKDNQENLKEIEYSEEKLNLISLDSDNHKQEFSIEQRTQKRVEFREQKRQLNIENITRNAVENLNSEPQVSEEPVDEDWISRFFNYAEDISNEEMQKLWGRILAGEVKKPNSFSTRTLELLRNLKTDEAKVFTKIASLVISTPNSPFIYRDTTEGFLDKYNISFEDQLLLTEIGILQVDTTIARRLPYNDQDYIIYFESGNYFIKHTKKAGSPELRIPIIRFSKIGEELLKLITVTPNQVYLQEFCKFIDSEGINTEYVFIISKNDDEVIHTQPWLKF